MFWKSAYQFKLTSFCSWFLMWLISLFSEAVFPLFYKYQLLLCTFDSYNSKGLDMLRHTVYRKKKAQTNRKTQTAFLFSINYLLISKFFNVLSISRHSTLVATPRTFLAAHPARLEIQPKIIQPSACCPLCHWPCLPDSIKVPCSLLLTLEAPSSVSIWKRCKSSEIHPWTFF